MSKDMPIGADVYETHPTTVLFRHPDPEKSMTVAFPSGMSMDSIAEASKKIYDEHIAPFVGAVSESFGLPSSMAEVRAANAQLPQQLSHPIDTMKQVAKSIMASTPSDPALLDKARQSWNAGNHVDAARHFMNFMTPFVGAGADRAGDELQQGEYGRALGHVSAAILPLLMGGEEAPVTSEAEAAKAAAAQYKPAQSAGTVGLRVKNEPVSRITAPLTEAERALNRHVDRFAGVKESLKSDRGEMEVPFTGRMGTVGKEPNAPTSKGGQPVVQRGAQQLKETAKPAPKAASVDVGRAEAEPQGGQEVGTLRPYGAGIEDKHDPTQVVGMDAIDRAEALRPGYKAKMAKSLAAYNDLGLNIRENELKNPDKVIEKVINHSLDNMRFIYDEMPPEIRDYAKEWYPVAHHIAEKKALSRGLSMEQGAGSMAVLSPNNPWPNNTELFHRMIDIYHDMPEHAWTDQMDKTGREIAGNSDNLKAYMSKIRGRRLSDLDDPVQKALWIRIYDEAHNNRHINLYAPDGSIIGKQLNEDGRPTKNSWIGLGHLGKLVSILEDGSMQNIHGKLGFEHKVRNFYNDIANPWSERGHGTADTHIVGASYMAPLGGDHPATAHNFGQTPEGGQGTPSSGPVGVNGTYPIYLEALRRGAAEKGVRPNQFQSMVWEGKKALFDKMPAGADAKINQVLKDWREGKVSSDLARKQIVEAAGGFNPPYWLKAMADRKLLSRRHPMFLDMWKKGK